MQVRVGVLVAQRLLCCGESRMWHGEAHRISTTSSPTTFSLPFFIAAKPGADEQDAAAPHAQDDGGAGRAPDPHEADGGQVLGALEGSDAFKTTMSSQLGVCKAQKDAEMSEFVECPGGERGKWSCFRERETGQMWRHEVLEMAIDRHQRSTSDCSTRHSKSLYW